MNHVMVDLETLGTAATSVFFACGACLFNPVSGAIGRTYSANIDIQEQLAAGRTVSADTISWWMQQSNEARGKITKPAIKLGTFLAEFAAFIPEDAFVWGNGATFDVSILEHAYGERKAPWRFWNVRDVRTLVDLASHKVRREDTPFEGVAHDALSDALHQAKYVSKMYQALKG